MKFQSFLTKWQKQIQLVFTIACFSGSGIVLYVGHQIFSDRLRLFWIFSGYIVILTGVVIVFGRRLIAMICD